MIHNSQNLMHLELTIYDEHHEYRPTNSWSGETYKEHTPNRGLQPSPAA
jgi:hypothetical protein